jgi:adenine-specific DNA-methyltransferase
MSALKKTESDRIQLQTKLDAAKTQADRNKLGQFATPALLADQVVSATLSLMSGHSPIRFLDPGFGTGSFFSSLLRFGSGTRLKKACGFEIDPHYGDKARLLWGHTSLDLRLEDFTKATPPSREEEKFNMVVCNPPYVRHHHLDFDQKIHLKLAVADLVGLSMNGLSGLYCYFMVLSQAWMTQKGVGVWLVPSEFMDVNYGVHVKRFLLDKVTLLRIHRFDPSDMQFDDALVSSAVVFFRNETPKPSHQVEFTFGGPIEKPKKSAAFTSDVLTAAPKWTGLLHGSSFRATSGEKGTLADLFAIKRGLATGCNNFFVLTPEKAREKGIPNKFLRPILPSPRELDVDEIEAGADGIPLIKSQRLLIDCSLSEAELRKQSPKLWSYLESGKKAGVDQGYLCSHRAPWYSQEKRPAPPLLCTYMGRPTQRSTTPFRFILNNSDATASNVYLLLYPKPVLSDLLAKSPGLLREVWHRLTQITGETLVGEGRIYGGGLHKMEPKELANVPAERLLEILPAYFRKPKQASLFD